jgi:tetraacyldisaccharide 4'-kinase
VRLVEEIWEGDTAAGRLARTALTPFEGLYRAVVAARGSLYDRGILESVQSPIPVISIGNLTVGGTGKTPVASWFAKRLTESGATPAIVLRGYGTDEILVHRELVPGLLVVADRNRPQGIRRAAAEGATVAVLDDAFQHRRAVRDADVVIVSADSWSGRVRLIPAGPWRERLDSIARASIALITRKAASEERADEVAQAISLVAPQLDQARIRLRMSSLVDASKHDQTADISSLSGMKVLAVSAVGDPTAFTRQISMTGAAVTAVVYEDHHPFSASDVDRIIHESKDYDIIVCTLKDAVKLRSLWPASGPALWYVSQSLDVETGAASLDTLLERFRPAK